MSIRILPLAAGFNALQQFGVFESLQNSFDDAGNFTPDITPITDSITDINAWIDGLAPFVGIKFARDVVGPCNIYKGKRLTISVL